MEQKKGSGFSCKIAHQKPEQLYMDANRNSLKQPKQAIVQQVLLQDLPIFLPTTIFRLLMLPE
jgi:hypothetical protein